MKAGVLLINLGTPDDPTPESVKRYLGEFLMDKEVIDIPFLFRWFLVKQIILRTRPKKSAAAYSQIWDSRGSPLRYHTQDFCLKMQAHLGPQYAVEYGMRYGNPSLESTLKKLKKQAVEKLIIFPLYPQYAMSSVGSSLNKVNEIIKSLSWNIQTERVKPFYDKNEFIEAWVPNSKLLINEFKSDHLLLSFHGLPERHVKATDLTKKHCLQSENCCEKIVDANANCYRAQCFATSKAIALKLNLKPSDYTVSFQSRLGTTPWIKPYTDFIYADLIKLGKKRLVVMCPAFIADCLETLEEIGIRGRQQFKGLGGEDLLLIPSLNSDESWVQGAAKLIKSQTTTC